MKNIKFIISVFCSLIAYENGHAAFLGLQKKESLGVQFTIAQARKVVAAWRNRVTAAAGDGSKVTASMPIIQSNRQTIVAALKTNPSDSEFRKALDQVRILLNLAEIREIITEAAQAKQSFPDVFRQFTGSEASDNEPSNENGQEYNKNWYSTSIRRLASLLKRFDEFTRRYPQILTSPPDLLVGIDQTLRQARETGAELQQYENCFKQPDQEYCAQIAATAVESEDRDRDRDRDDPGDFDYLRG